MDCDYRLHSMVEKISIPHAENFIVRDIPFNSYRNQHISTFYHTEENQC